jgi:DNA-directed RNA polymerase subunit RPC12/RpoP
MVLVALKCPNCGGTVQMEENMKSGFCAHCGSKIVNEPNVGGSVSIDKSLDIVNHLKVAKETLIEQNWEAATRLVENILLMDPDCKDAWYMKVLLCYRNRAQYESTLARMNDKELKDYNIFSEEDIKKCWGKYNLYVSYTNPMPFKARTAIDGNGTFLIDNNGSTIFGINPGQHEISTQLCGVTEGPVFKSSFIVDNNNYKIEIKSNLDGKVGISDPMPMGSVDIPNLLKTTNVQVSYNSAMDQIKVQFPQLQWEAYSFKEYVSKDLKDKLRVTVDDMVEVKYGGLFGEHRNFRELNEAIKFIGLMIKTHSR